MTELSRRDVSRLIAAAMLTGSAAVTGMMSVAEAAFPAVPSGTFIHPNKGLMQMTNDLAKLSAEHFDVLIGERFAIGDQILTLRSVRRGPETPSRFREQFSLTFDIPDGSAIRSEVLPVVHPAIGAHQLLVTQVMDSVHPTSLEICFS